jgi:hypothetical protein
MIVEHFYKRRSLVYQVDFKKIVKTIFYRISQPGEELNKALTETKRIIFCAFLRN